VVDDDDAVGQLLGLVEVVGGEQHGHAVGSQVGHDATDELAAGGVDAGGGLVEEGDLGAPDEGEGEREPLLLAA